MSFPLSRWSSLRRILSQRGGTCLRSTVHRKAVALWDAVWRTVDLPNWWKICRSTRGVPVGCTKKPQHPGSQLATLDVHIIPHVALPSTSCSISGCRTKGKSTIKHSSWIHTDVSLLVALWKDGQRTVMEMKWEKRFSAAESILGAGRQRMEMSALCLCLWSASYLKLTLR